MLPILSYVQHYKKYHAARFEAASVQYGLNQLEIDILLFLHNNPDCRAVVHLHCTHLTALSCLEGLDPANVIRPFTPYYVMRVGQLPLIPYYKPGDARIAEELGRRAPEGNAFLLANHGPVVTGKDLVDAVNNMEELQETARLALMLHGQSIRYLSEPEITELRSLKP